MRAEFEKKLPIPMEVKERIPLPASLAALWSERDRELKEILSGKSNKLLLVIGPCSADREDSVLEYLYRLRGLQERVRDTVFILPRLFTNKPRTTGDGYKGMLHQPDPLEKPDLLRGIVASRQLHMKAIRETGFTCADEMLYPENYKYVDDLLGYITVGARSVENQQHRLTASAVECPCGMKNPTSGNLSVMLNGIHAAQQKHTFLYRGWEIHSEGNPFAHAVLRGYITRHGQCLPNYHYEDLLLLSELYAEKDLLCPACLVDTNHDNSGKQFDQQARIALEVLHSRRQSNAVRALVKGFVIESYLEDGCQPVDGGWFGKSITDPCLGWDKTNTLVLELADRFV